MGPIALFDKSFLQSLSLDESVWFAHYFYPVVCPVFYVETLADLEKTLPGGRTAEREVQIIADKFPDNGNPCVYHGTMMRSDLFGRHVPMDGRIPLVGGQDKELDGKRGIIYESSPERDAFARWQRREFFDVERNFARAWRAALANVDIGVLKPFLNSLGLGSAACKSLDEAYMLAKTMVDLKSPRPAALAGLLEIFLGLSQKDVRDVLVRWQQGNYPPLVEHAPYAAFVLTVELFFQFSMAASQIGTERPSNRVDMAYLNYLPFCQVFISTDRIHRRCARFFLRDDQQFVWGEDLKADLARINAHFMQFPETEREKGIITFAAAPPQVDGSIVRDLRRKYLGETYDERRPIVPPKEGDPMHEKIFSDLERWENAPPPAGEPNTEPDLDTRLDMLMISRQVSKKKGSWYQLPKDMKNRPKKG